MAHDRLQNSLIKEKGEKTDMKSAIASRKEDYNNKCFKRVAKPQE